MLRSSMVASPDVGLADPDMGLADMHDLTNKK